MIKVVSFDFSLNNLGVAWSEVEALNSVKVVDVGLISPDKAGAETKKQVRKNSDDLRRAKWLQKKMIACCEGQDLAVVEMPFGSQSARAMAAYGISIGVLASCPLPLIEVTPNEVKLAGAGFKTATKDEMIEWAMKRHPEVKWLTANRGGKSVMTKKNEHIADAIAALHAGMDTTEFKLMMAIRKIDAA